MAEGEDDHDDSTAPPARKTRSGRSAPSASGGLSPGRKSSRLASKRTTGATADAETGTSASPPVSPSKKSVSFAAEDPVVIEIEVAKRPSPLKQRPRKERRSGNKERRSGNKDRGKEKAAKSAEEPEGGGGNNTRASAFWHPFQPI